MWSLRTKSDNTFYLTYDFYRRYTSNMPGLWELVGPQNKAETARLVEINQAAGYLCCPDDENNVRALVLTGDNQLCF
jgi:hypothetical protein